MAYVSWEMLARLILGGADASRTGYSLSALPLLASLIMVAWDLAQDPVWGTVLHGWVWLNGGRWFGVPLSNYFGWYLTVFAIYLVFALYLRRVPAPALPGNQAFNRLALLFYLFCAVGNVLQFFSPQVSTWAQDPTGKQWRIADITAASAMVSVLVMGSFVALAWIRLRKQDKFATD